MTDAETDFDVRSDGGSRVFVSISEIMDGGDDLTADVNDALDTLRERDDVTVTERPRRR